MKYCKNKVSAGFTLIELLVVISIIGLLSSIVLAALSTARTSGTNAKITQEVSALRQALELSMSNGV